MLFSFLLKWGSSVVKAKGLETIEIKIDLFTDIDTDIKYVNKCKKKEYYCELFSICDLVEMYISI